MLLALAGCEAPERPGELVGRYQVMGALMRNDCGADALPALDPLNFDVEIRDNQGVGLWYFGSPPAISGSLEADGTFRFQFGQQVQVTAPGTRTMTEPEEPSDFWEAEPGVEVNEAGCHMRIVETVDGRLHRDLREAADVELDGSEASESDLTAVNLIEVSAAAGSDCHASLAEHGGVFRALPCAAEYQLAGTLIEE